MSATFDELREEILDLSSDLLDRARAANAPLTAARLGAALLRLVDGKLIAVFCGEFNRGKSTLLNVLLDRTDPLFPTSAQPKTRLVTSVEYGDREEYFAVLTRPDGTVERRRLLREEIEQYAAEPERAAARDSQDAATVQLFVPDERLKSGLVLVDTPGVGGVYGAHSRITENILPTADAIVFVASVQEPLREAELGFLTAAGAALRAADTGDALLVAFNMIDSRADYRDLLEETRRRVAERTGRTLAQTPVYPVSGRAKLHYLRTGDEAYLEESQIPQLEAALWTQLERRRARVLLGETLREARSTVNALLSPLLAQERALRDDTGAELARLRTDAEAKQARLDQLRDEGAQWRTEVHVQLVALGEAMQDRADEALDTIWRRAHTDMLAQEHYLVRPERMDQQLNSEFGLAMSGVAEWGGRRATEIQRDCAARCGLDLSGRSLGALAGVSVVNLPAYQTLVTRSRKVWHEHTPHRVETGGGHYESGSGNRPSLAARIVVGVVGLFSKKAGRSVAGDLGMRWVPETKLISGGYYTVEDEGFSPDELDRRRTDLRAELDQARPRQRAIVAGALAARVEEFAAAVSAEMDSLIGQEAETLDNTLPLLEQARTQTEDEARARLAEIDGLRQPLLAAEQAAARLAAEVEALGGRPRTTG